MPGPLGKIPSPLELVDGAADIVNQVARMPGRVVEGLASGVASTTGKLMSDIKSPADYKQTPKPPAVLIKPVFSGVAHVVEGAISVVKGGLNGVVQTFDGIKGDVDQRLSR